jgi:hypothetical protein
MIYLILSLVLVLIAVLTLVPAFRKKIGRFPEAMNFTLTVIATLIGVLIAISISVYEENKKEQESVIKFLNAGIDVIRSNLAYTRGLAEIYNKAPDSLRQELIENNPIPYPDFLEELFRKDLVWQNISQRNLSELNIMMINLKKSDDYRNLAIFTIQLELVIQLLEIEIQFQQNQLDETDLNQKIENLEKEFSRTLEESGLMYQDLEYNGEN